MLFCFAFVVDAAAPTPIPSSHLLDGMQHKPQHDSSFEQPGQYPRLGSVVSAFTNGLTRETPSSFAIATVLMAAATISIDTNCVATPPQFHRHHSRHQQHTKRCMRTGQLQQPLVWQCRCECATPQRDNKSRNPSTATPGCNAPSDGACDNAGGHRHVIVHLQPTALAVWSREVRLQSRSG